tara:strand:+ start:8221 stop:9432 length:1212 start_codon:yes stop_codon:yes gene_type:complete
MPGPNPFSEFEFPEPIELDPLPPYEGNAGNYGGFEDQYGGEGGDLDRLVHFPEGDGGGGDLRAFRPYGLVQNSGTGLWECYITAGLVLDNHILNMAECGSGSSGENSSGEVEDAVEWRIPAIGGVGIIDPKCSSGWTRPVLILPDIPSYIYAHFKTDHHGNIIPLDSDASSGDAVDGVFVEIVAYGSEKKSVNHVPPSPDISQDRKGDYYWLLAEICSGSSGSAEIVHRHQSNILWPGEFGISNDSAAFGSRVYRKFDKCLGDYKLRKIRGCYGIIDGENVENLELAFQGENVGTYTGTSHPDQPITYVGADVYVDSDGQSCGGKAQFRLISPNSTVNPPQILPLRSGNLVEIRGNGNEGSLTWRNCDESVSEDQVLLEWKDGLVTTEGAKVFIAGCPEPDGT